MAELTKSNVTTTVFGDRRIVMFEVDVTTAGGHAVTGLDYVNWAGIQNEDATGDTIHVTKNSNNGTANTLNGSVWIDMSTNTRTISVIAIGK